MLTELTAQAKDGQHLSAEQAEAALDRILTGECEDGDIADLLIALADKGEDVEEIVGFARAMRRRALGSPSTRSDLVDTAGTGGGADSFNVSTTAAFVIAAAGAAVAKHGNRAVTSKCGSADVLAELGVRIDLPPEIANRCLDELSVAFFFAPSFHPAMKRVAQVRRGLGRRTIFNLLGPLTNPMGAPCQVVGVFSPDLTEKLAQALAALGSRRAWVVHSRDGLDELSPASPSKVGEVSEGEVRCFDFDPARHGFAQDGEPIPKGGDPGRNARIVRQVLEGELRGRAREIVVLNAAAALHLVNGESLGESLQRAEQALDSGAALHKLQRLIEETNRSF